jgi:poly-gamma-glutamate synthesis protein (capsule biosynthesis protein)
MISTLSFKENDMKRKIISTLLCLVAIGATFWLLFYGPSEPLPSPTTEEAITLPDTEQDVPTTLSRTYVIKAAHDVEDLIDRLAVGADKSYEKSIPDLAERFQKSAEYLKDELSDFEGASYFTIISGILQDLAATPFTDSVSFSQRVSQILTSLESAYPAEAAQKINPNDADSPMYYPSFDTNANGKTAAALLAVYRQQVQKNSNSVLITVGGNVIFGDTLLGSEDENSFQSLQQKNELPYPFYKLSPILLTDSASFANLEAPLTESIGTATEAGSIKGLPKYASLLKSAGIDGVSLGNSSILSYGEEGKNDTKAALDEAGVIYSDEGKIAYQQTSLGIAAFLTYDIIEEIGKNVNLTYADAPKQDIAAAREAGAKFIVVQFNWVNTEKKDWDPCMSQILTARAAVDNGADLVFGSHTNAIEAIEQYKGKSIVYSAGDLFTKQNTSTFLFQQAFTLDSEGNAVPGEMFLLPIMKGEGGIPTPVLDAESATAFQNEIIKASSTVRYGTEKKNGFSKDKLNMIFIQK